MLRLRIKQLMKDKGIKAPLEELKKLGISHAIGHKYLEGKKQWIVIEHIEAICLHLRCAPSDLFEWAPDNPKLFDADHPMQALKPKSEFDPIKAMKNMTPDEIRKRLGDEGKG